jgi:glutamate racemase
LKIGILDSGIGGLTVLHQAMLTLPKEDFIYYADTDNVPYGTKSRDEIIGYVDQAVDFLVRQEVKAIVIACNTAPVLPLIIYVKSIPFRSWEWSRR